MNVLQYFSYAVFDIITKSLNQIRSNGQTKLISFDTITVLIRYSLQTTNIAHTNPFVIRCWTIYYVNPICDDKHEAYLVSSKELGILCNICQIRMRYICHIFSRGECQYELIHNWKLWWTQIQTVRISFWIFKRQQYLEEKTN